MYLYLIQHAESKSKEEDPERGLTDRGFEEIGRVAEHFRRLNPDIYVIWHSGKKRAEQTARSLARSLGLEQRVLSHTGLNPMDDIGSIQEILEKTETNNIAIVGHLPHLSRLASSLLAGDPEKDLVRFRNAGILCLVREEPKWQIGWMITPEVLP